MSLDIARIRAICFDIDGTLSDTDDVLVHQLSRRLRPLRFLFPQRNPKAFVRRVIMAIESPGNLALAILDRLGIDDQVARFGDKLYEIGIHRPPKKWTEIPGALALLKSLHERFPISLVSARGARSTQAFIQQFQLDGYLAAVAHAQTCRYTKPYPDPILWAAREMGVAPETCLMIGDTTMDIRAGVSAGAQTVGVLCGFGEREELEAAGADLILGTTEDLFSFL